MRYFKVKVYNLHDEFLYFFIMLGKTKNQIEHVLDQCAEDSEINKDLGKFEIEFLSGGIKL